MKRLLLLALITFITLGVRSQELNAKVTINSAQIAASAGKEIFDELQSQLQNFINDKKWTELQFREHERINCSFALTINKWESGSGLFECTLLMSSTRPVYNSSYNTTVWSVKDANFNFNYMQGDQFEFNPENIDNNLIAMIAYYAYMIIGMDLESFAPKGGTDILHIAEDIVSKSENLGFEGWKPFSDNKNRFGLLNDYLDGSMESMRNLFYKYHREGLDHMTDNQDDARAAIMEAIEMLDEARQARNMSALPQLFTEFKRDEIVNIFSGKGTSEQRNRVYDILSVIDPSQVTRLERLKK